MEVTKVNGKVHLPNRWRDIEKLFLRQGNIVGPGFEPGPEILEFIQNDCRILVVGAGGLGCELLKDLALSGFGQIDVIDMDTIDVSNLNRQFLFRLQDVGKPKAIVAAEKIMQRVKGVKVNPHFCRIEDKPLEFYEQFQIIVLGLDSLEARSWINSVICSFLEYNEDGSLDMGTIKPMVDGGTEGFKGHARVILPGVTPCFHCTLWLFPPQVTYPLCTLAEIPRSPAHCIEYVHLIQWGQERANECFDADNPEHMKWVYEKALLRAQSYSINGVTYSLTQGVVKNIIPAIASTNAIISSACALEVLKLATVFSTGMDNYMMYVGNQGVYTHTVRYEKDENCVVCSSGVLFEVDSDITLFQMIDIIQEDSRFTKPVTEPSISFQGSNLYMQAPPVLEEMTRSNLDKRLIDLMGGDLKNVLNVTSKNVSGILRVRVNFK